MDTIINPRLRWSCRRGMLELDVLLGNYLEEAYLSSSIEDQKKFVDLLDCNDQELFMWLTGKETPLEPELIDIIGKIRHHAKVRKHASSL